MSEHPAAPKPRPLFEETWVPFQTSDLTGQTVLVLAPHPDDESIGCGGAIALHRRQGDPVKVVFLTDGRRGDETQRYDPHVYIAMRQREARAACAVLGVTDLEFWDQPDRGLLPDSATIQRLISLLRAYQPGLIYAPSPLEFHPDHLAAAELTWRAVQAGHITTDVAFYEINQPLRVNLLVNIDTVLEQKQRACNLYPSQLANRSHSDFALGLNRYRSLTVASSCTYAEGFFRMQSQEIGAHPSAEFARRQWAHKTEREETMPLVSIIIRTQDRLSLLRDALASVAQQTYPRLEVIVVNDGGADVRPIVDEFRSSLDIQLCTHTSPTGRAAAANTGLRTARGDLINFLDDDDRLYPHHIERLVLFLQMTGGRLVYADCEMGHYQAAAGGYALVGKRLPYGETDFDPDRLLLNNYIPLMTVMFTRELATEVGLFDESLAILEDWDYWLRAAQVTSFHHLPGITAEYRVFDRPVYDYSHWKQMVLRKHHSGSAVKMALVTALSRIEVLQSERTRVNSGRVAQEQAESSSVALLGGIPQLQRHWSARASRIVHRLMISGMRLLRRS